MRFTFQNLHVYRRSVDLGQRLVRLCDEFPRGRYALADQLRRAVVSISCNLAEGNGRWHEKERKHFFMIARGSAYECVPVLEIARDLEIVGEADFEDIMNELDEICRMIGGLIKNAGKKKEHQ